MLKMLPLSKKLTVLMICFCTFFMNFYSNVAHAQDNANAGLNETQKQVLQQAKEYSSEDKNTITSLLMIAAVLCVVGFAMYLAFKSDGSEKKRNFARTPKKEF